MPCLDWLQVTLHNSALINMDSDPRGGFKKLTFLLQSPPFPPETFANLLLLYCKPTHGFYDLAADVLAENPQYASKFLTQVRCVYMAVHDKHPFPYEASSPVQQEASAEWCRIRFAVSVLGQKTNTRCTTPKREHSFSVVAASTTMFVIPSLIPVIIHP